LKVTHATVQRLYGQPVERAYWGRARLTCNTACDGGEPRGNPHAGISLAFRLGALAWAGAALAVRWLAVGGLAARPVHFRAD
jgi:hypothetical protein